MHENLKFSIILDKNIKEFESMSSIQNQFNNSAEKAKISDWQAIYSQNNYGTQYLIYCKFIGDKLTDTSFKIKKIQLFLQNYDGSISIGFNDYVSFKELIMTSDDPDNKDPRFKSKNRKKYKLTLGLEAFKIEKNYIYKNVDIVINKGDLLSSESFFTPALTNLSLIYNQESINNSNFVDPEFMKRIGDDIFITETGYDKLLALNTLGLINNKELFNTGIKIDGEQTIETYKKNKAILGRKYPCVPRNSIFYIQ